MMRRALTLVILAALFGCATSRRDPTPTHVRLTTWPEVAHIELHCGALRFAGPAPLDFDFPAGEDARCTGDIAADHYQTLHVSIDRQFLFDHGALKYRGDVYRAPHPVTTGPMNVFEAVILSVDDAIEYLVTAGRNAAHAKDPDVTLKIALQPESSS